jgi:hypothetical protein
MPALLIIQGRGTNGTSPKASGGTIWEMVFMYRITVPMKLMLFLKHDRRIVSVNRAGLIFDII